MSGYLKSIIEARGRDRRMKGPTNENMALIAMSDLQGYWKLQKLKVCSSKKLEDMCPPTLRDKENHMLVEARKKLAELIVL